MRFIPLMLLASPAAAHTGAHLHPHGGGSWLAVVLALSAIALAAVLAWRAKA